MLCSCKVINLLFLTHITDQKLYPSSNHCIVAADQHLGPAQGSHLQSALCSVLPARQFGRLPAGPSPLAHPADAALFMLAAWQSVRWPSAECRAVEAAAAQRRGRQGQRRGRRDRRGVGRCGAAAARLGQGETAWGGSNSGRMQGE